MEYHIRQLERQCVARLGQGEIGRHPDWPAFRQRLAVEFPRLVNLLWPLYGCQPDFAYQLEDCLSEAFLAYSRRPRRLRDFDRAREAGSAQQGSPLPVATVGAVCYVDLFAGGFRALIERIPYLRELGIGYLHIMPFFRVPPHENDGGYAISSYRETDPRLGSMEDLSALAGALAEAGIELVADFVFNHTSDGHDWAERARSGDEKFQKYYLMYDDASQTALYQQRLRDIFPEHRKGSFTWCQEAGKWVWTTFNSYQWDLNYRNPEVFRAMAEELYHLANRGITVLRLDAVAFIWKELGTNCENRPEAHQLIRAFQVMVRLVCPGLLFKSEAIVHPDDIIRYIDRRECQLSYNPLLMAEVWEAAATKEVRLLAHSLAKRHQVPDGCAWINYVRCHDDIGWTFADEDAAELGINGHDHRQFLNDFYLGSFPGSFSRGVSFQYNPATGDRRICGTAASLCGIELASETGSSAMQETAIRRMLLLYGLMYSAGGIPLVYLGDELGVLNDYSYRQRPAHAADSRWVHRVAWDDGLAAQRHDPGSLAGRIFGTLCRYAALRQKYPVLGQQGLAVLESGHPSVLAFHKHHECGVLTVLANFAEATVCLPPERMNAFLGSCLGRPPSGGKDLLDDRLVLPGEALELQACGLHWIWSAPLAVG